MAEAVSAGRRGEVSGGGEAVEEASAAADAMRDNQPQPDAVAIPLGRTTRCHPSPVASSPVHAPSPRAASPPLPPLSPPLPLRLPPSSEPSACRPARSLPASARPRPLPQPSPPPPATGLGSSPAGGLASTPPATASVHRTGREREGGREEEKKKCSQNDEDITLSDTHVTSHVPMIIPSQSTSPSPVPPKTTLTPNRSSAFMPTPI
uniref:Uncharacterized protein n=1 Tax=Oryza sativa subsp. japonica TaxID=39947 RepID=Q69SZ5_ORYSJ|nr:hypothetical protein [Oryza sativa Japonica Group]